MIHENFPLQKVEIHVGQFMKNFLLEITAIQLVVKLSSNFTKPIINLMPWFID